MEAAMWEDYSPYRGQNPKGNRRDAKVKKKR